MRKFIFAASIFVLLGLVIPDGRGAAKDPEIIVTSSAEQVVLYVRDLIMITPDTEKTILAGTRVNLIYRVQLLEERGLWFDRMIADLLFTNSIKHDTVKKIFQVWSAGQKEPLVFSDMEAALAAVKELNNMPLAPVSQLRKGGDYYVRVKARLVEERHRMLLDFFSIITSFRDQETDWFPHRLVF